MRSLSMNAWINGPGHDNLAQTELGASPGTPRLTNYKENH